MDNKTGVTGFGFVENLKTFINDFNTLISETGKEIKTYEFNKIRMGSI